MSILDVLNQHRAFDIPSFLASCDATRVERVLAKSRLDEKDFLTLLSPAAAGLLERLAERAHELTRRHFGQVVQLFTPLYISNVCENRCRYCSFSAEYAIVRKHLSIDDIRAEAGAVSATGMRHILLLTGEARRVATPEYLADAVRAVKAFFSSVAIEVYPLTEEEYGALVTAGVDCLTIYQEVYDEAVYRRLHAGGPKSDYGFRLQAPERAARRNIHAVTIGALLGLADFRTESFACALHLGYLRKAFPGLEVSVSLPRIRPLVGDFPIEHPVTDREFVQLLTAYRIAFPTIGITVSTREAAPFRDAILPMGVTKMSAGVSTAVGGHTGKSATGQFEIADTRSVDEMKADLLRMGYQPVMHDWSHRLVSVKPA
jgi:2-iminoacetate synthase